MLRPLFIVTLLTILSWSHIHAQGNVEVMFVEANNLYESARYDEAVRMYNRILQIDEDHTPSILMRGKTKYELGAFKGTKMDAALYLEKAGATKEWVRLMAETEFKLDNIPAAWGHVSTAVELDPYDAKMHFLAGEIAIEYGLKNDACEHYARGAILGSNKAERAVIKICGGISKWVDQTMPTEVATERTEGDPLTQAEIDEANAQKEETTPASSEDNEATDPFDMIEDEAGKTDGPQTSPTSTGQPSDTTPPATNTGKVEPTDISLGDVVKSDPEPPKDELPPVNIDATQDIKIDEQLTVTIANGLGERKLNTKPNIFMLSNTDGLVVIDVCVAQNGKVVDAEFNRDASTIFRSSLTSLALRKTKEFTFLPSKREEQCGSLIYNIKA